MSRGRWVRGAVLAAVSVPLAACSEVTEAVDTANGAMDKAAACSEALGIATSFDPRALDPQRLQAEAARKAQRMRELGNQVTDASVSDALFAVADGYVELEQRKAERLGEANQWLQRNAENLNHLRQVCL